MLPSHNIVGLVDGWLDGCDDGLLDGWLEGCDDGWLEGCLDGFDEGCDVGDDMGFNVGSGWNVGADGIIDVKNLTLLNLITTVPLHTFEPKHPSLSSSVWL